MSKSLIGRQVRLTGEEWDRLLIGDEFNVGTVHTIVEDKDFSDYGPGCVGIQGGTPSSRFYVAIDDDASSENVRDWAGELLPQPGAEPEVRPHVVGFLDGLLGLHRQDVGGDYDQGYDRGRSVRVAIS